MFCCISRFIRFTNQKIFEDFFIFQEFNSRGNSLAAFAYKDKKLIDARIFLENKNNFQVLLEDCDLLVLYVPFFENPLPTFELDYLCEFSIFLNIN